MKKVHFFAAIALSALMVSCGKQAPTEESQKEALNQAASTEMAAIRTAQELAKYGYEVESASALIEAANILVSTPTQAMDAEFTAGETTETGDKAEKPALTPAKLIADAKELADEDEVLLAMVAKVEKKLAADAEGTRGAVGGPKYDYGTVYARDYAYYDASFIANQLAEVVVSGDGDTDLDLYVYDSNGNLIASDTDFTDDCYVRWYPKWTGRFRIKIVNRGGVYNNYVIATN